MMSLILVTNVGPIQTERGMCCETSSVEALPISGQKLTVASSSQERMDFGMRASNETP
jgi:hypothetical protein